MSAIGPGSLLLCVDSSDFQDDRLIFLGDLKEGCVYECVGIAEHIYGRCARDGCAPHGVVIAGLVTAPRCVNRFVPAGNRGDFKSLLQPIDIPAEPEEVNA